MWVGTGWRKRLNLNSVPVLYFPLHFRPLTLYKADLISGVLIGSQGKPSKICWLAFLHFNPASATEQVGTMRTSLGWPVVPLCPVLSAPCVCHSSAGMSGGAWRSTRHPLQAQLQLQWGGTAPRGSAGCGFLVQIRNAAGQTLPSQELLFGGFCFLFG